MTIYEVNTPTRTMYIEDTSESSARENLANVGVTGDYRITVFDGTADDIPNPDGVPGGLYCGNCDIWHPGQCIQDSEG